MKIIAQSGATTKNSPADSKEALVLGINSKYVVGVAVTVQSTKDNFSVVYSPQSKQPTYLLDISTLSLEQVKKQQLGSKVKYHQIQQLDEVLSLFNYTNKILVIEIIGPEDNTISFINRVIMEINKYPNANTYLASDNIDIVSYLQEISIRAKIGIVINDMSDWNLDTDFYLTPTSNINPTIINEKLNQNKAVMIDSVNSQIQFEKTKQLLNDTIEKVYIITNKIPLISNNQSS